jgi:hypothetical protein
MSSIAEVFGNPLIAFLLGLTPAIITSIVTVVLYYKKRTTAKERGLSQPILKLYDLVSKIREEENALNLQKNYLQLEHTSNEWRILTERKQVLGQQPTAKENEEYFGKYLFNFLDFSRSRLSAMRLVDKCLAFEEEYKKMDNQGLLSLFKKRHNSTFTKISDLEFGVRGILFMTERARTNRANNPQNVEPFTNETVLNVQVTEYLDALFKIRSVATELFSIAPEVEKQLGKFL